MPLSKFQKQIFSLLKQSRNPESYIAGGTAIHQSDDSIRYSNDIDFFHDTDEAVSSAFANDRDVLIQHSYSFKILLSQPSFYRAVVSKGPESLKLEWVRDTAFRFFPVIEDPELGFRLHDIDLAVNKCIALANRSELRDLIDIMHLHEKVLSLAGCCWAACGKDPGFTPELILEMIQRHAVISPDLLAAESLVKKIDPLKLKKDFTKILDDTRRIVKSLDAKTLGCVFVNGNGEVLHAPTKASSESAHPHYGTVKGSWPRIVP